MHETRCTAIVPVHRLEARELRYLDRILRALLDAGVAAVVVAEQWSRQGSPAAVAELLAELGESEGRVTHFRMDSELPSFEMCRLVNCAQSSVETAWMWIHEPRYWLEFRAVVEQLRGSSAVAIKPFEGYHCCDRAQTEQLLAGEVRPGGGVVAGQRLLGRGIGKASYLIDTAVFRALGGLNERFVGASDAGFELMRRLRYHFKAVECCCEIGAELFRPTTAAERYERERNKQLQERLAQQFLAEPEAYAGQYLRSGLEYDAGELERSARRQARELAFHRSYSMPTPGLPELLPGSAWGITSYFNPARYRSKRENYAHFRAGAARVGLPLLTVELSFDGAGFELARGDAEQLLQLSAGDVLWQKERLLNIALQHLPADCDKGFWLDAEVLVERDDWLRRSVDLLESFVMVQPFSRSVRLRSGETRLVVDDLPLGNGEHELLHSIAYGVWAKGPGCLDRYLEHGHSGYAWAGRRRVLEQHGFYDANILGNADLNMAQAMFGGADAIRSDRLGAKARRHLEDWAGRFYRDVGGSVGFVDGLLYHLWHGDKVDRLYDRRLRVLIEQDYDPERDLAIAANGVYRWASDKPELQRWCRRYFQLRREDRGQGTVG